LWYGFYWKRIAIFGRSELEISFEILFVEQNGA